MTEHKVVRSTCGLCQIGCGVLVYVDGGRAVKVEGDPESPLNRGVLCSKGLASLEYLYHPDRLQYPLKRVGERGAGRWARTGWDDALSLVADGLTRIRNKYGAESVAFIRGGAKVGFQDEALARFANVFGSPNILAMAHLCFIPRTTASTLTYGFYAIPDFDYPPARIVVWGMNLAENLHHVYRRMVKAVEKGARLMVIDPVKIAGVEKSDLWLKPRPGSDLALALGMINTIINEGLYDAAFVHQWTAGFDELATHVQEYSPERVADVTWVPAKMIREAARFYSTARPACIQWGNAVDHGVNSFQTARAICILRAITGNLEIPGGEIQWSLPPLLTRASPSVSLPEKIPAEVRQRRITTEDKPLPILFYALPQGIIKAMLDGDPYPVRAAYIQGCNPLLTYSNARQVYQAFTGLDFLAVADIFMTPTASLADVVLPVTTYLEFDGIAIPPYSEAVALIQQRVTRVGECRSDYEILRDLARRLGGGDYFWDTEEEYMNFILGPCGLSFNEFRKTAALTGTRSYHAYLSRGFATPSGKVELYSKRLKEWDFDPLPTYREPPQTPKSAPELAGEYPLVFTEGKRECYKHSGGRQIARLRRGYPEPVISIHPATAGELGIGDGDPVYIETPGGRIRQRATLSSDIDPRVVMVDYGWWFPEDAADLYGWAKSNVNMLTYDQPPFNREMGSPNLRCTVCKVYKAPA